MVSKLSPWFLLGFSDAESCFSIALSKDFKRKTGWLVYIEFKITLHEKDRALLELIQFSFDEVGSITTAGKGLIKYQVRSIKDLIVIIDHFDKYPLISQKWADYQLFNQAFEIINRKEHLNPKGIQKKIVNLKVYMNNGLPDILKAAFPNTIPVQRPLTESQAPINIDPNWLAGFVSGEGCFFY